MGAASNDITTVRRVKRTWEKGLALKSAGDQVSVRSFSDLEVIFSAYHLCCVVWQPVIWGAGQHPDSQHTATSSHHPKSNGGESSTAEQSVHWESVGRTGPPDSIFLSHFLCMCLSHYFIFSPWSQSGQQNSDWNVVLATSGGHSQILCCLSLSSLSFHIWNSVACIFIWASAVGLAY